MVRVGNAALERWRKPPANCNSPHPRQVCLSSTLRLSEGFKTPHGPFWMSCMVGRIRSLRRSLAGKLPPFPPSRSRFRGAGQPHAPRSLSAAVAVPPAPSRPCRCACSASTPGCSAPHCSPVRNRCGSGSHPPASSSPRRDGSRSPLSSASDAASAVGTPTPSPAVGISAVVVLASRVGLPRGVTRIVRCTSKNASQPGSPPPPPPAYADPTARAPVPSTCRSGAPPGRTASIPVSHPLAFVRIPLQIGSNYSTLGRGQDQAATLWWRLGRSRQWR